MRSHAGAVETGEGASRGAASKGTPARAAFPLFSANPTQEITVGIEGQGPSVGENKAISLVILGPLPVSESGVRRADFVI